MNKRTLNPQDNLDQLFNEIVRNVWIAEALIEEKNLDDDPTLVEMAETLLRYVRSFLELARRYAPCQECWDLQAVVRDAECVPCMNLRRLGEGLAPYHPATRERAGRYNLTIPDLQRRLNAAAGHCEICDTPLTDPFVDHNHETGEVRGILCRRCNTGLGIFGDNPEHLASAVEYLTERGHYASLTEGMDA